MSLDLLTSFFALLIPLWVVIACIHPATGGVAGWHKRYIVLTGFIAFIVLTLVAPTPDTSASEATTMWEVLLIINFMAILIGWPVIAITLRFGNPPALFKKLNHSSKALPDAKVVYTPQPQPAPKIDVAKSGFFSEPKSKPIQKTKKPSAPKESRAIAHGWSIGEVCFTYEDVDGQITCRTVTAHSVTTQYLKGECHDRKAERTFRLDRIIGDVVDCDTGEIMSPRAWAKSKR